MSKRILEKLGRGFKDRLTAVWGMAGTVVLYVGTLPVVYAGSGSYGDACNGLLLLVEGTFGALITAAAGVGAIVASAVGGFKMAWSLVVVSVGSFILRSFITLFNGSCGCPTC